VNGRVDDDIFFCTFDDPKDVRPPDLFTVMNEIGHGAFVGFGSGQGNRAYAVCFHGKFLVFSFARVSYCIEENIRPWTIFIEIILD
jgi:hypothetical protein